MPFYTLPFNSVSRLNNNNKKNSCNRNLEKTLSHQIAIYIDTLDFSKMIYGKAKKKKNDSDA